MAHYGIVRKANIPEADSGEAVQQPGTSSGVLWIDIEDIVVQQEHAPLAGNS